MSPDRTPSASTTASATVSGSSTTPAKAPGAKSCPGQPDKTGPDCPSLNGESESIDTASKDVKEWLQKNDSRGPNGWNEALGAESGGGFLKGQTTVQVIKKGTKIFRHWGGDANEMGGWWFETAMKNPIAEAALPEGNSAEHVAAGEVLEDVKVLTGPGAPRCSGKPGGPKQLLFPRPYPKYIKIAGP